MIYHKKEAKARMSCLLGMLLDWELQNGRLPSVRSKVQLRQVVVNNCFSVMKMFSSGWSVRL